MAGNLLLRAVNLTQIPACGISCLAAGLNHTTCAPTNQTCLCFDTAYANFLDICITANCTVIEGFSIQRATSLGCGFPAKDNGQEYLVMTVLPFALSSLFFFLRLANRALHMAPWGWDDTTIVLAWLLNTLFLVGGFLDRSLGIGKDYWALTASQINASMKVYYAGEYVYMLALGLIKASICFLFLRIFENKTVQRLVWATQIFNLLLVLAFVAVVIAQCRPINYFWHLWDGEHEGTCVDINAVTYAHSAFNIALDVWMLILPATQVWRLNMSVKWKLEASAVFAVGLFLTAISMVRLSTLSHFFTNPSSPRGYIITAGWTIAELAVGIIVACIPAARIVVVHYASNLIHTAKWPRRWSLKSAQSDGAVLFPNMNAVTTSTTNGRDSRQSSTATAVTETQAIQASQMAMKDGVDNGNKKRPPLRGIRRWWAAVAGGTRWHRQGRQQQGKGGNTRDLEKGRAQTVEEG